jgi:hypothetical protein
LQTKAGEVSLKVPKLRTLPFETAIIERYQRRESSVEEALIEMYLAGVSVRRIEDITEALWPQVIPISNEASILELAKGKGAQDPCPKQPDHLNSWSESLASKITALLPRAKKR